MEMVTGLVMEIVVTSYLVVLASLGQVLPPKGVGGGPIVVHFDVQLIQKHVKIFPSRLFYEVRGVLAQANRSDKYLYSGFTFVLSGSNTNQMNIFFKTSHKLIALQK